MTEHCPHCGQRIKIGQSQLSRGEKQRFDWGGPTDEVNIIRAQVVKAAAQYYGIEDWAAQWDPTLTPDENVALLRQRGTEPTMRELRGQYND